MGHGDSTPSKGGVPRMPQNNNAIYVERVTELYDVVIDLITYQDEHDNCCQTRINNLGDLLDDTFLYCDYAQYQEFCIDKDTFLADSKVHCNQYKDVEDVIKITENSNSYGDASILLSVKLINLQMDDCEMIKTYDEEITYNDGGLITKISVESEAKETLICPSTDGYAEEEAQYGEEQELNLPPVAVSDHVTTDANTPVMIDVLENDYDPDQDQVYGKQALEITHFTQGSKGRVEQEGDKLIYLPNKDECGSDTFTYWIKDLDSLRDSADVHIEIACPAYVEEPVVGSYGQQTNSDYNMREMNEDYDTY